MDNSVDDFILALLRWFVKELEPIVLEQSVLMALAAQQDFELADLQETIEALETELAWYQSRDPKGIH